MIDTLLNLLLRCSHRRLTRPITAVSKAGVPHDGAYVVCLDCGKQFAYDLRQMRIGKAIDTAHESNVLPTEPRKPAGGKLKIALLASVPLAMLIGSALKSGKGAGAGPPKLPRDPRPPKPDPKPRG